MIRYEMMSKEHVSQVAALEAQCFHTPWSENAIGGELKNPLSAWFVALDGDQVVGYVGSQSVLGEADMMNLAVKDSYRRQGIAKQLIQSLIQRLSGAQVHSLSLEVRVSNDAAISLYSQMGFLQVGRRPNYYTNPKEDAWILRKEWEA